MREDIKKMISENKFCVLATVGDGKPHCSLMSYATDADCSEIYMATLTHTKKYLNVMANPAVSLLIDTRIEGLPGQKGGARALTVTGVMQSEIAEQQKKWIRQLLLKRHPDLKPFLEDPEVEVMVIKAKAVQLLDGLTDAFFEQV